FDLVGEVIRQPADEVEPVRRNLVGSGDEGLVSHVASERVVMAPGPAQAADTGMPGRRNCSEWRKQLPHWQVPGAGVQPLIQRASGAGAAGGSKPARPRSP